MAYKGKRFRRSYGVMSDINVTPLVDVMLVLLIVFMITAPLARFGFEIKLPKVEASAATKEETYVIVVHRNKKIMLNDKDVTLSTLENRLAEITRKNPDQDVFLRADESLPYGYVMQVMGGARRSGVRNLGMVTEPLPVRK
ncbi:MAG: biopolymer transporter ExbD [Nitrospinae bacterium]|nr:biopolymer transporter ExbD [Nitrospinota bacterium]